MPNKPMRIDVNYDSISNDSNSDFYERDLDLIGALLHKSHEGFTV